MTLTKGGRNYEDISGKIKLRKAGDWAAEFWAVDKNHTKPSR